MMGLEASPCFAGVFILCPEYYTFSVRKSYTNMIMQGIRNGSIENGDLGIGVCPGLPKPSYGYLVGGQCNLPGFIIQPDEEEGKDSR